MHIVDMFNGDVSLVVANDEKKAPRVGQGLKVEGGGNCEFAKKMWATNLPPGVTEYHGLGDRQCIIQIAESVEFPFLLLHSYEELFDPLQRQLVTFDEDTNRVSHELGRHLQNIVRERGAQQDDLRGRWEVSVDLVDLVFETLVQQLVCFVKHEHLDVPRPKTSPPNHVENSSGCTRDDMLPVLEFTNIFTNGGAPNTRVALHVHVVSQGEDDRLNLSRELSGGRQNEGLGLPDGDVDGLEDRYGERRGFTGTGLSLGDHVSPLGDWKDGALLDRRGLFKVCSVKRKRFGLGS